MADAAQAPSASAFDPQAIMAAAAAGKPMPVLGASPVAPAKGDLPDWAIYGPGTVKPNAGPAAPSFDAQAIMSAAAAGKSVPMPTPPSDQSTWAGALSAIPSGLYAGVADLANLPGNLWNMASNVAAGFGIGEPGQPGYGQVPQLINPNPTGYIPRGPVERSVYAGAEAVPSALAFNPEAAAISRGANAAARIAETTLPRLAPVARTAADVAGATSKMPIVPALVPTAVGGAAQQASAEAGLPPWAQTGIGLAAGVGAGFGQEAALAAGRGVGNLAGWRNIPFVTPPVETPAGTMPGRTISVRPAEAARAGQRLSEALGSEGVAAVQNAPDETIAGDNPTMAELVAGTPAMEGQPGVAQTVALEKTYRSSPYAPPFIERAQQQNAARIAAVNSMAGAGNVASPGQWLATQLADIDQRTQAAIDAARGGVTGATAAAGGTEAPEALGAMAGQAVDAMQQPRVAQATSGVDQALAARNSALGALPAGQTAVVGGATAAEATGAEIRRQALLERYQAAKQLQDLRDEIDPTGQAGTQAAPFQQAVAAPYANLPRSAPAITPGEQQIRAIVGGWSPLVPVSEVFGLRERVGNEISTALSPANPNRAAAARLQQVKGGIDATLAAIVDQQAVAEQAAVQRGRMAPEDTLAARLAGTDEQQAGTSGARRAGIRPQAPRVDPGAAGRAGTVGGVRAQAAGAVEGVLPPVRLGNAATNRGLAAGAATQVERSSAKPQSLVDFLIRHGGVRDQTGDLRAIGAETVHFRQGGRLVNPKGLTPDHAREIAEEAGFLRPDSTISDLYDALAEHISGRPQYRISEQAEGDARSSMEREAARNDAAMERARGDALAAAHRLGETLPNAVIDDAAERIVMHGLSPHEAVLSADFDYSNGALQANAERLAFSGRPGMPAAEQVQMGLQGGGAGGPIRPMTADELAAYRRYLGVAQQFKQRFDEGAVGDVLAYGEHRTAAEVPSEISRARGGFGKSDAEVVGTILRKGVTEAEAVRQAEAAGIKPETLTGALADELRARAVKPDGSFDLAEYRKFLRDHAGALHVFDDTREAFDGAAAAQQTLEDRQTDLAAVHAGHPLKGVHAAEVMGKYWVPGDTGGARVREFARDTGHNAAADRALDDYAVYRLRAEGAIGQNGMVDPAALDRYRRKYQQAIAARPTLQAKLATLDTAQRAYDTAVATRAAALHAYQGRLVQSFIEDEPLRAIARAFETSDSGKNIAELKAKLGGNADAIAGLRRLAGDYILKRLSSLAPEGASDRNMLSAQRFRGFVEDNKVALRELFGGQGMNTLDAIAANMRRSAQRSMAAAGSDTVPKALGIAKEGLGLHEKPHMSLIGGIVGEHLPDVLGFAHPVVKIATTIGGATANLLRSKLRAAAMTRQNDLMLAALLHPTTVGRAVLNFANAEKPTGLMARQLAVQLQSLVAADQQSREARKGAQ